MKILHLTHTDIPSDNRILKEIIALSEVPKFQLHGIGIRQIQGGKDTKKGVQAKIVSLDLLSRKLRLLPGFLRHPLVAIELFIRLFFRGLVLRPDVVHCHDTPVLLVGVLLKRLLGAMLVYDAHELESNKNGQSGLIARITFWVEKISWSSIDHFISVSPSIIEWYQNQLGKKANSLILNSPLIPSQENQSDDLRQREARYFHEKYAIPETSRVFLYLGLLVPGRGIELMLDAFSSEGITSHIVFVGYGSLGEQIQRAANANNRIHLHPPVPHEEVVALSRSADFGLCIIENVSLSDYYCLPNKLFEYAFAGIPVLASSFPDISLLVNEHGLGECCDTDVGSIVDAVRRIERQLGTHLPRKLEALGWQRQSNRLRHAYTSMMNRSDWECEG